MTNLFSLIYRGKVLIIIISKKLWDFNNVLVRRLNAYLFQISIGLKSMHVKLQQSIKLKKCNFV